LHIDHLEYMFLTKSTLIHDFDVLFIPIKMSQTIPLEHFGIKGLLLSQCNNLTASASSTQLQ
jgi:hypothetical protein